MKLNLFGLAKLRWFAAFLSCMTMVFSPLAIGKEAEKINKAQLEKYISEFGLDKKTTLGEFWEKSKSYYSGAFYADLEAYVEQNKNLEMPELSLDTSKGTDGFEIPVVRLSQRGKTQTIQFFGEKNKWARFNGVNLSEKDLERIQDAFVRIEASDIKLKREAEQFQKNQLLKKKNPPKIDQSQINQYKTDFARFNGFPRMTPQLWKSMSKIERAGFIVKMRLLWLDAQQVLKYNELAPSENESSSIQNFYKVIFGQEAYAISSVAGAVTPSALVKVKGATVRTQEGKVVSIPYDAKSCVVAGYIGAYVNNVENSHGKNRAGCSADVAIATYKNNNGFKFVQDANDTCVADYGANFVACNPIIYGYPNGKEACISKLSDEFQYATHFSTPSGADSCDAKSRLSSSADIIKFSEKDYSNIQPRAKQIAAIEEDQKQDNYKRTQDYLKGVLSKRDPIMLALLEKGEWNLELDNELVKIQSQFEDIIESAIKTCEADISGKHEKNQKQACDQLHRRWLFTEREISKLRDKACLKPALYVGFYKENESSYQNDKATEKTLLNKKTIDEKGTSLCQCPAPSETSEGKKVNFGQTCSEPAVVQPEPIVEPGKCADNTNEITDETTTEVSCVCKDNPAVIVKRGEVAKCDKPAVKCDKPEGIEDFDYQKCECNDGKKLEKNKDGKYECEGKNWLPWVLGAGALAILAALFFRHKKPKTPPPVVVPGQCPTGKTGTPPMCVCSNKCPSGIPPNPDSCGCDPIVVPPSCAAPKVGTPPNCVCPAAPSFCTPPQKIYDLNSCQCTDIPQPPICPNNKPAPNGNTALCPKCPNGSFEPPAGCPTEGGGGNNCPQGGCSGGLPKTGK